ncbi:Ig-like domain-containing protein [Streptomyces sp. NPDC048604]|uniref:Ig-like domain-containing protein n=1 Tax=Streptomyces sp. NPDC048604 TaxID=3365578 RepID=UPI0037150640
MNHVLCSGRAVGTEESSPGVAHASLYCSQPPFSGVAPGDIVQLGLSVAVDGAPFAYAYLQEKYFGGAAEVVSVQDVEYFPRQRQYRVRAEPGENGIGFVWIRVKEPKKKEPRLRPHIAVALPNRDTGKLVRTGSLRDTSLLIRTMFAPGLRIVTAPGAQGSVHVLSAAPQGSTPIEVDQPRHGTAHLTHDGWLTYLPQPGFTGYDRFRYTVALPDGSKTTAPVNVLVGEPADRPGVFPEQPAVTDFQPWQWSNLTGEMPWPRPTDRPHHG